MYVISCILGIRDTESS